MVKYSLGSSVLEPPVPVNDQCVRSCFFSGVTTLQMFSSDIIVLFFFFNHYYLFAFSNSCLDGNSGLDLSGATQL